MFSETPKPVRLHGLWWGRRTKREERRGGPDDAFYSRLNLSSSTVYGGEGGRSGRKEEEDRTTPFTARAPQKDADNHGFPRYPSHTFAIPRRPSICTGEKWPIVQTSICKAPCYTRTPTSGERREEDLLQVKCQGQFRNAESPSGRSAG